MQFKVGKDIFDIVIFYFNQLNKIFKIWDSVEIFPGISYFKLVILVSILCIILGIIKQGTKEYLEDKVSVPYEKLSNYTGKHSQEYLAKHSKTGLKVSKESKKMKRRISRTGHI